MEAENQRLVEASGVVHVKTRRGSTWKVDRRRHPDEMMHSQLTFTWNILISLLKLHWAVIFTIKLVCVSQTWVTQRIVIRYTIIIACWPVRNDPPRHRGRRLARDI